MDRDRDKMAENIIHLTLEILFRLTGEDYTVVKKTSSDRRQAPVFEGCERTLSPIMGPPPHPLIHEEINEQKILELTYKMIELLTGEVPIRCQDVTVYFSMEEWEYLEGRKDQYKEIMMEDPYKKFMMEDPYKEVVMENPYKEVVMEDRYKEVIMDNQYKEVVMEDPQPLILQVTSSKRTSPERCPRPSPPPQDLKTMVYNVPQDYQGKGLMNINATSIIVKEETYVGDDEPCMEVDPADSCLDYWNKSLEGLLISSDFKTDDSGITQDIYEQQADIKDIYSALHSKDLSSVDSSQTGNSHRRDVGYQRGHAGGKPFFCSECGERFALKTTLVVHQISHTREKPYSCSECGKCFTLKSNLVAHERIHTGEKLHLCSECEKCFTVKSSLVRHQRIHTGSKPYSCSVCGKSFTVKSNLVAHERTHTGEKSYSCSECGKCFTVKSSLVRHERIHTGSKPFSCSECGKCFSQKSNLVSHERIHTGEKPF